jgi:RimJ/RimL family protein N-acetyltransferase
MIGGMADITVRQASVADWRLWRELRLAALHDAPYAFGTTYAEASARDDDWWRAQWSAPGVRLLVEANGVAVGMCGLFLPEDSTGHPMLISMWVAPEGRGTGAAGALLDAAIAWTRDAGHAALVLGVVEDNAPARRLYERFGFTPTGESEPLRSNLTKTIITMGRAVG